MWCIQGPDDGSGWDQRQRPDCLEPPAGGGLAFCDQPHRPGTEGARGFRVDQPIDVWAPNGSEATLYCYQFLDEPSDDPPARCAGNITLSILDPAPDACLFSADAWSDYHSLAWSETVDDIPLPWEGAHARTELSNRYCGDSFNEQCPAPSGLFTATSRFEWCGDSSTDWSPGDPPYACDYRPAFTFGGLITLEQLSPSFACPKQVLNAQPRFIVPGAGADASRAAGALGGAYCNAFAPRPMLGRLPEENRYPNRALAGVPLTVFARRDPARCEDQRERFGFAEPTLDPGIAQSGQLATVLPGSVLVMTRDGDAGPPTRMPVDGEAAVWVGPVGGFALTDFELHQAVDEVQYTDASGTYTVRNGVLRMSDVWAGTYAGPGASPNVVLHAHASSTTMTFSFNGNQFSIPLTPDRSPQGDFNGVDRLSLHAHYRDEPDRADFDLVLVLDVHPRPAAVIDEVSLAPGCRTLSDGSLGTVLTARGHAAEGTTFWQLGPEVDPSAASPFVTIETRPGATASFEVPLGAPSDPAYQLTFTVRTGAQVSRDVQRGIALRDTTAPVFDSVSISPSCLWPPDHGYVLFRLGEEVRASASDDCSPEVRVRISNVVSDQAELAPGSGHTTDDAIFGDTGFCLRAEREGTTQGPRTYTVTLEASDPSGNVSTYDTAVEVRHDQRPSGCLEAAPDAHVRSEDVATACAFEHVPELAPPPSRFTPRMPPATREPPADTALCATAPGSRAPWLGGLLMAALATLLHRRR